MKIKTADLTGAALDWAVAVCENVELDERNAPIWFDEDGPEAKRVKYSPSTDWAIGGRIIERENIAVFPMREAKRIVWGAMFEKRGCEAIEMRDEEKWYRWMFCFDAGDVTSAETPLIAAMRCYVEGKMRQEIDVPDEVLGGKGPERLRASVEG